MTSSSSISDKIKFHISLIDVCFYGFIFVFIFLMKQNNMILVYGAIVGLFIVSLLICYKRPEYLIVLLLLFMTQFFGFIPSKIGNIQIGKLLIIILIDSYILWALKRFNKPNLSSSRCVFLVLTFLLLLFGSIMATFKINQSVFLGFFYQLRIINYFMIIPLSYLLIKGNCFKKIERYIICFSVIFSIILIIQSILVNNIVFLEIDESFERLGKLRISIGFQLFIISIFLLIDKLMKKFSFTFLVGLMIILYSFVFIYQGRMAMLGTAIGAFIIAIFNGNFKSKYKFFGFIFFIFFFSVIIFVLRDYFVDLFVLTQSEVESSTGSYAARIGEIDFYVSQIDNTWEVIFGRGYISPKTPGGEELDTLYNYYSLTDIGFIGLFVTNGIFGVFWWLFAHFLILLDIKKLRSLKDSAGLSIGYLVFSIVTCYSLLNIYYSATVLILILVMNHVRIRDLECQRLVSMSCNYN